MGKYNMTDDKKKLLEKLHDGCGDMLNKIEDAIKVLDKAKEEEQKRKKKQQSFDMK